MNDKNVDRLAKVLLCAEQVHEYKSDSGKTVFSHTSQMFDEGTARQLAAVLDENNVLSFPCNIGNVLYCLPYSTLPVIEEKEIGQIRISGKNNACIGFYEDTCDRLPFATVADIGITAFLSRELAEAAAESRKA